MTEAKSMAKGLYFEDFKVEGVFETESRTVTESDIINFAGLTGDWNSLHTDAEYAKTTTYGERIAHGLLGLAISSGLAVRSGIYDGTLVGFLGMEWKFTQPIKIGDTIRQRSIVRETKETSKPDRGVVVFAIQVLNQRNEVVQEGTRTVMMKRR
ncbi:MAG: MaoC/PaaZ C-terminal domain-containing protein [Bdellovibrionia bacterium]